jgi:hypothetical protein
VSYCATCQRRESRIAVDKADVYRATRIALSRRDGATARDLAAIERAKTQLQINQDNLARHLADEH